MVLVFLPAIVMTISLLEALNKTCIVYSTMGIKHMGEKYERERDLEFLKTTMLKSDKGDPEMRIKGLRTLIFKPETLTRV